MYAKVFAQIFDGTLCTKGPWEALVTFQQLLVLADQEGNVDMTASAISRRTTIPLEIIEKGLEALLLPDPESRTPTEQGRRILPLSEGRAWGWRIVNYVHYRQLKREDDRRAYHREYWHKRKLKDSTETQHTQPNQPIAYAEAKAEAETSITADAVKPSRAKPKTKLPVDFSPNDVGVSKAWGSGLDPDAELAKFLNHHLAKGSAMADWQAAYRTWIDKAKQFQRPSFEEKRATTVPGPVGRDPALIKAEKDAANASPPPASFKEFRDKMKNSSGV